MWMCVSMIGNAGFSGWAWAAAIVACAANGSSGIDPTNTLRNIPPLVYDRFASGVNPSILSVSELPAPQEKMPTRHSNECEIVCRVDGDMPDGRGRPGAGATV
jgi:hypothetical protein